MNFIAMQTIVMLMQSHAMVFYSLSIFLFFFHLSYYRSFLHEICALANDGISQVRWAIFSSEVVFGVSFSVVWVRIKSVILYWFVDVIWEQQWDNSPPISASDVISFRFMFFCCCIDWILIVTHKMLIERPRWHFLNYRIHGTLVHVRQMFISNKGYERRKKFSFIFIKAPVVMIIMMVCHQYNFFMLMAFINLSIDRYLKMCINHE